MNMFNNLNLIIMKKQMIIVGKGARVLSEKEMKHVLGGQDDIIIGDLTACNNKKCSKPSDCKSGICASMTCQGRFERHCM